MEQADFAKEISAGRIRGVYLFEGTEEYSKQEALANIRRKLLPAGLEELNESVLEDGDTDRIIAMAETMPFASEKRLVVVRNHPALMGAKEADDRLSEYLSRVPEWCVVIFYCIGKANGVKKLYKAIKKCGEIINFAPLSDTALSSWIIGQFKENGKECRMDTASSVSFTVGSDMALLREEIGKISASVGERSNVTPEDVQNIATKSSECRVFDLINAVIAGREGQAFMMLKSMLTAGEQRLGILAMLLRQYRMMQQVKILQMDKASMSAIASHLKMSEFIARKYVSQASNYTSRQIKEGVNLLLDTEFKVKSGQINENGALENALLALFAMRH